MSRLPFRLRDTRRNSFWVQFIWSRLWSSTGSSASRSRSASALAHTTSTSRFPRSSSAIPATVTGRFLTVFFAGPWPRFRAGLRAPL